MFYETFNVNRYATCMYKFLDYSILAQILALFLGMRSLGF
jgi:hypothetical protein